MSGHYQELERDLIVVLAEVGSGLEPVESQEVQMYLEAGEYGLALETICAVLKQKQIAVSAATYVKIMDLGERMEVDPNNWQDLQVS